MLTPQFAKKFGRKQVFLATAIPFVCLFLTGLYFETRGDFSNGILFFVEAISNIRVILFLALVFGLSYFLGGKAGTEIMIDHKNFAITGLKYAVIISFVLLLYSLVINYIFKTIDREDMALFMLLQSWIFVPFVLIWLWATYKMILKVKAIL
jgi:hypothetical protein